MKLTIQNLKKDEWILLHDFYSDSPEPDAPKCKYLELDEKQKVEARAHYDSDSFKSVSSDGTVIGFLGFFPDDDDNVNIFYVLSSEKRGMGYFSKILSMALDYCRSNFTGYRYIRGLTRRENQSSIRGLERMGFIRKGSVVEDVQPEIVYEEYVLLL